MYQFLVQLIILWQGNVLFEMLFVDQSKPAPRINICYGSISVALLPLALL